MDYLTRPVFEFEVDWSDAPAKSFSFDLREILLGFGAEYFSGLQQHVVQGYKFNVLLADADELDAFDDFFADLTGRLSGFWLPTPFEAMQIVTADDATHFYIADQNLRSTFADHPDIYVLLSRPGTVRAAKIANVESASNGREKVTLTAALGTPATTADTCVRLHYVRLAADIEEGEFLKEGGTMDRTVKVIELPHEYEAFETGESPIWLYHFSCAVPMDTHWRYTSFAAGVVSGNKLFNAFPITHKGLKRSAKLDAETLNIEAKFDAAHPFALFLPLPLGKPLTVEVLQVTLADPDTAVRVFTGKVRVVEDEGDKLIARCDAWTAVLKQKAPGLLIGRDCPHVIFESNTCRLARWKFETTATVASVDNDSRPPVLVLDLDNPGSSQAANWLSENWFAGGFVETGFSTAYTMRSVLTSYDDGGQLRLELNHALAIEVGDQVSLIPDCGGLATKCQAFKNYENFGGFPAVPEKNPTLKAMDAIVSQGGKK